MHCPRLSAAPTPARQFGRGEQEGTAARVQQPLGRRAGLDRIVRQTVRLQVILLFVIHRHEQPLRDREARPAHYQQRGRDCGARTAKKTHHRHHDSVGGILLFAKSSSRRACGTSALCGYARIMCSRCAAAPVASFFRRGIAPTPAHLRRPENPSPAREFVSDRDGLGVVSHRRLAARPSATAATELQPNARRRRRCRSLRARERLPRAGAVSTLRRAISPVRARLRRFSCHCEVARRQVS